jgi:pyruvate/2-oxoglutarate dehydrogenase complex dihydrolipoamide acyltransferase (E2) component
MSENETDSTAAEGPPQVEVLDKAPPVDPALREKILADPNVARLAQELGVPLDEYVNQIGYYINNPGVQPALAMASDEDLRNKLGVEPPTFQEIEANLKASNDAFMAGQAPSGFDGPRKKTIELSSQGGKAIDVDPEKTDPKLLDAVKKGRFPSKG